MSTVYCGICGGYIFGELPDITSVNPCICPKPRLRGWECPRCHKIHSPFSLTCDCAPDFITRIAYGTKEETK